MKLSDPIYYVDPLEFLALGALAQAPRLNMSRRALMKHLRSLCWISAPAGVIGGLQAKALVDVSEDKSRVTLTEIGALARRDPGHEGVPAFVTVPEYFFIHTEEVG